MELFEKIKKTRIRAQLTPTEREKTGRILKLVRLKAGMQQAEFASQVGLSQAAISMIESGKREISAGLYRDIKKEFNISELEWDLGVLDNGNPVQYVEELDKNITEMYGVPKKYSYQCGSNVRTCLPLVDSFKKIYGAPKWKDFLKTRGFKFDGQVYFYNFDHPININFAFDLISEIQKKVELNNEGINRITQNFSQVKSHGTLSKNYLSKSDPIERLESLVQNATKYDINTNYILADMNKNKDVTIFVKPNPHLHTFSTIRDDFYSFLGHYKKGILENFSQLNNSEYKVEVDLVEDWSKKNNRWIYTVRHLAI